jgi:GT2 family glycosyltransferase
LPASQFRASVTRLSIVSVTYQSAAVVPRLLHTLRGLAHDAEIILVDNASMDRTTSVAADCDDQVQVVQLSRNEGYGRAANIGALRASGDWLLFVNPDVELLEVPWPPAADDARFGVGAPELLLQGDGRTGTPTVLAETTVAEDWAREVACRFLPPAVARRLPIRKRPAGWASGAVMLVRRAEFIQLSGFDRRYFLLYEDRDLCARYRRAGLPIRPVPGLRGLHRAHSSSGPVTVARSAWGILSWLEYIAIWHGDRAAARCAEAVLGSFRTALATTPKALQRSRRVARKLDEVDALLGFLTNAADHLPNDDRTFYPGGRRALGVALGRPA